MMMLRHLSYCERHPKIVDLIILMSWVGEIHETPRCESFECSRKWNHRQPQHEISKTFVLCVQETCIHMKEARCEANRQLQKEIWKTPTCLCYCVCDGITYKHRNVVRCSTRRELHNEIWDQLSLWGIAYKYAIGLRKFEVVRGATHRQLKT